MSVGDDVMAADLEQVQTVPLGDGPEQLGIDHLEDSDLLPLVPSGFAPLGPDTAWVVDLANRRVVLIRDGAAVPDTAVPVSDLAEDAVALTDGTVVVVESADGADLLTVSPRGQVGRVRVAPDEGARRLVAGDLVADGDRLALWTFDIGLTRYDGLYQLPVSELHPAAGTPRVRLPPPAETGLCRDDRDCLDVSFTSENQLTIIAGSRRVHISIVATGDRPPFVSLDSLAPGSDGIDLLLDVGGECAGCSGFYWLRLDDDLEVESWYRVPLEDEAEHSPRLRSRLRRSPDGTLWVFDVREERFVLMRLTAPAVGG